MGLKLEEQIRQEYLKAGQSGKDEALFRLKERGYDDEDALDLLNEWDESAAGDDEEDTFENRAPRMDESMESGGIADFVPENPVDVEDSERVNERTIREPTKKPLSERIDARKKRNSELREALEYEEQEWTNDDGKPSAYEAKRAEVVSTKKKARGDLDDLDWEREFDDKTHKVRRDNAWKLNRQEDEFLNFCAKMEQEGTGTREERDFEADFDETDWDDYDFDD